MKTKSLLLGSAAALFAVTGARAADAVIIPEPEVVEYVRVCDAAGTGFFYIPGTETCLKISGYVNMDFEFAEGREANDWDYEARVAFESWTDSEYGPVTTMIRTTAAAPAHEPFNVYLDANAPRVGLGFEDASSSLNVDRAYLEIAGLRMGLDASAFDFGISGELDIFGNGRTTGVVRYTATVGATSVFLSLEEDSQHGIRSTITALNGGTFPITTGPFASLLDENDWMPNIVGGISGSFGDLSYTLAAAYDASGLRTAAADPFGGNPTGGILGSYGSAWSVKGTASYAGFNIGAQYTSNADQSGGLLSALSVPSAIGALIDTSLDSNAYAGPGEWYVAASYDWQASDKLLVTPAVHYANDTNFKRAGTPSVWGVGLTAKYDITDTLWVRGAINYNDPSTSDGTWTSQIRFRAEF